MTIEPKLMDPERLALIEQDESLMPVSMAKGWSVAARQTEVLAVLQLIRELRADRAWHRARVDVTDDDLRAVQLTIGPHWSGCAKFETWLEVNTTERQRIDIHGYRTTTTRAVNIIARTVGCAPLDVLGEIAAMVPS